MKLNRSLDVRLIVLCTTCFLLPAFACPSQCICKWKNGKRYVECTDKDLKSIPNSLDSETQVLDFTGNDLQVLQKETFHKLGLLDLQKIYLQRCRLQKIDNAAFRGLANLVEIDLSNNYITVIPSTNFIFFPSLMRLSLNNNPISSIKTHCFQHLSYLNTLELSNCKIETIETEAFAGLKHLEWLRLNGNRLSNIQGDSLFPDTLRGIDLQNNNWNCDCHLRDLHSWLSNFNMPHAVEPICSQPERLKKRTITSIDEFDLACLPKIAPTTLFIETNIGNNVSLECMVKAVPEAKIQWFYQGQLIRNYSTSAAEPHHVFFVENGVIDKKSELYIYNIGTDDNGTYSCLAENSAGKARMNYTIKIIVKEEPVVIVVTFPHRHLVVIVTVIFLIIVLLIAIIAVVLLKFKTDTRSRKKKESGKDVAMCNQILPSGRTNGSLAKNNGSLIVNAHSHHALHYTVQTNRDFESHDTYQSNNMKGFVDRNPDLINDAETVANNALNENTASVYKTQNANDSFEDDSVFSTQPVQRQVTWQDQQTTTNMSLPQNAMYQHSADVHLNPGCFLDNDGYPFDYGLPKHPCRQPIMSNYSMVGPFYQTLPHNRPKGQKLVCKFAKDNEFNASSPPCPNYEVFNANNVRRTLEGYPVPRNRQIAFVGNGTVYFNEEFVPSPPEGYKSEPVQCCAPEACAPWSPKGTCAVMVPVGIAETPGRCYQVETRCVDTQTTDTRAAEGPENVLKPLPQVSNAKCAADICSESPDEGYVGDTNDI
ncbi:leucine-rich repeat-containing protein 24 [Leptidea sinapis]|uniref:leucine-rich repeat-containing protein 24 n=1 Tax=Leptidea sinapis TaxID=189913 RepID=UPI0021C41028|nr:leucine-rich repeat-containing protein 24 [Leptidea sinapis]